MITFETQAKLVPCYINFNIFFFKIPFIISLWINPNWNNPFRVNPFRTYSFQTLFSYPLFKLTLFRFILLKIFFSTNLGTNSFSNIPFLLLFESNSFSVFLFQSFGWRIFYGFLNRNLCMFFSFENILIILFDLRKL